MTVDDLGALPEAWRGDRLLLGDRRRRRVTAVLGDDDAVLVVLAGESGTSLLGLGDPARARRLLDGLEGPVAWMTLPRLGAGPAGVRGEPEDEGPRHDPDDDLPPAVRARLGVRVATAWDWLATDDPPDEAHAGPVVEALDPQTEAEAIRDCLVEANPGSSADPLEPGEAAWFGVRDGDRLTGVIGAGERTGRPEGADLSWHLHGLGVRPSARGAGLGGALTAAATRAGFSAGADWVSLGMYASNTTARRVYVRLGYRVEDRFTSYRGSGAHQH